MSEDEPWKDLLNNAAGGSYRIVKVNKGTIEKAVGYCGTASDMIDAAVRNSSIANPDPQLFGTPPYGDLPANLSSRITRMGSDLVNKIVPAYRAAIGQFGEALIKARGLMVAADRNEPAAAYKRITGDSVNTPPPPNGRYNIGPITVSGSAPPPDCLDYTGMRTFAASLQQAPGSLAEIGTAWGEMSAKLKAGFDYLQTNISATTKDAWKGDGADRAMQAMNRLVEVSGELTDRMDSMAGLLTEAAGWTRSMLDAMPPPGAYTTDKKEQNAQVRAANAALDGVYIPGLNATRGLPQLPPPTGIKGLDGNTGNGTSPHNDGGGKNAGNNHISNKYNSNEYNGANHNSGGHSTNNGPTRAGQQEHTDGSHHTHQTGSQAPKDLHSVRHVAEQPVRGTTDHRMTTASETPATTARGIPPADVIQSSRASRANLPASPTTGPETYQRAGDQTGTEHEKPVGQDKKKTTDPAAQKAEKAGEQQVLQIAEQVLGQIPQVLQRITQDAGSNAAQHAGNPPGPIPTTGMVASALKNAIKGAAARGSGAGKSTSPPARDSAAPHDPATSSKLFPRAMVAAEDSTTPDTDRAGIAAGAGDPGQPTMPPPGGMGAGAARGGQASLVHKRAEYLNSTEHLGEAIGTTPVADKPVVGK